MWRRIKLIMSFIYTHNTSPRKFKRVPKTKSYYEAVEKQNKLWNLEERLEELDKKILDIENNNMEKNYLLKSGKLLNNYYKLL